MNIPHSQITQNSFTKYSKDTLFVVYCWGPGCNGASKDALKIATLDFTVKEMMGVFITGKTLSATLLT
ncbi:hypothetical protein [Pseudoalteromonas sp. '520P1 No. 412']|uniref:hypothetical protein n=1 Tax=unclassified Pseudoalteromonas TaxID=194690 RepID=UPI00307BF0DC